MFNVKAHVPLLLCSCLVEALRQVKYYKIEHTSLRTKALKTLVSGNNNTRSLRGCWPACMVPVGSKAWNYNNRPGASLRRGGARMPGHGGRVRWMEQRRHINMRFKLVLLGRTYLCSLYDTWRSQHSWHNQNN